jgi:hypothetical protein
MDKSEILDIVKDEIRKFKESSLDSEVSKIMKQGSSKTRKELIDSIKNSLESAFKMFWVKRDFWKTDIK